MCLNQPLLVLSRCDFFLPFLLQNKGIMNYREYEHNLYKSQHKAVSDLNENGSNKEVYK